HHAPRDTSSQSDSALDYPRPPDISRSPPAPALPLALPPVSPAPDPRSARLPTASRLPRSRSPIALIPRREESPPLFLPPLSSRLLAASARQSFASPSSS